MAQIAKFRKERGKEEVVISGSESDNDSLSEDEMVADDIKVGEKTGSVCFMMSVGSGRIKNSNLPKKNQIIRSGFVSTLWAKI